MFRLPDSWVWDFWLVDDAGEFHLFFLYASRALHDPHRRHRRASIGHAVSEDLTRWRRLPDALVRGDFPAFDDVATWTGCTVKGPDGRWYLFYTGASDTERGLVQRIGFATSDDLMRWDKHPGNPILEADPRWYEKLADGQWHDEAWRDPWVFPDPQGDGWHMLVTARSNEGPADERGVVGHATSQDLRSWVVHPPLSAPGAGFGQLEVCHLAQVDGRWVLLFNCLSGEFSTARLAASHQGGVWALPLDDPLGPFDIAAAVPLTDERRYVGRPVQDRSGAWVLLAFDNLDADLAFVGAISDPLPLAWRGDTLVLADERGEAPAS